MVNIVFALFGNIVTDFKYYSFYATIVQIALTVNEYFHKMYDVCMT